MVWQYAESKSENERVIVPKTKCCLLFVNVCHTCIATAWYRFGAILEKLLMEESTCCNLCIKWYMNTKTDTQRKTFYCDEFPSPMTVHVGFLFCFQLCCWNLWGDHSQMAMPICSWIGTHPNPTEPAVAAFFFALGITFLALPDGIPKAKIQFLQPLGRKEGPSNMTQKTVVLTKRITPLELYRYREIAWHNPLDAAPPSHLRRLDAYSARTPKAMV